MKKALGVLLILAATAVLGYAVYNTAWLSDDAYISFRSLDNLVHGYGLTWNTDERVQSFTNPLWVLANVPAYLCVQAPWHIYFSSLATSAAVTLMAALVLALGVARRPAIAVFVLIALAFCRGFVEYSTSGLENPMTHLLLAMFVLYMQRGRWTFPTLFSMSLCAGLSLVNRMDTALIYAPVLAYAWLAERNLKATLVMAAGMLPFLAWEAFSVVYYGFPFPNTAYAKLGNGIDSTEVIFQGLWYLWNAWNTDPLTLCLIVAGVAAAPLALREGKYTALAFGALLYLAYLVKVGGDFMQGRLLTPVLMVAVLLLVRMPMRSWAVSVVAIALAVGISMRAPDAPIFSGMSNATRQFDARRVANEREFWMPSTGLKFYKPGRQFPIHRFVDDGEKLAASGRYEARSFASIGFRGYFAGTKAHIIDDYALADPLLARIPAIFVPNWRIGHFTRVVPKWYLARKTALANALQEKAGTGRALNVDEAAVAVPLNENVVEPVPATLAPGTRANLDDDPDLQAFYDRLELIVRGPLWSKARWQAILNMNLGRYNHLVHRDSYRFPNLPVRPAADVATPMPKGTKWDAPGTLPVSARGVEIQWGSVKHNSLLEMSGDHNDNYRILFRNGEQTVGKADLPPATGFSGINVMSVSVPNTAIRTGYDAVLIVPYAGDKKYSLGHVILK